MHNEIDLAWLIAGGTLGMTTLASFIIIFLVVYQKRLLKQKQIIQALELQHSHEMIEATFSTQENERERIATNMHDGVGMLLNTTKNNIAALNATRTDEKQHKKLINETKDLLQLAVDNIRAISKDLLPPTLKKFGLVKGLADLCRRTSISGIMDISFTHIGPEIELPKKTEVQLYRITQEVINNIMKHAGAEQLELILTTSRQSLKLAINHNGEGLPQDKVIELSQEQKGIGLNSILSRALIIGANVQYIVIGPQQSKVLVEMPVNEKEN